jgi:glycine cleavage system aminomethyltransferase T
MLAIHEEAGGKIVDFEGYKLPVHYASQGIMSETHWCRSKASIFDVSHMGQIHLRGADTAKFLELCTPTDVQGIQTVSHAVLVLPFSAMAAFLCHRVMAITRYF